MAVMTTPEMLLITAIAVLAYVIYQRGVVLARLTEHVRQIESCVKCPLRGGREMPVGKYDFKDGKH